MREDVLDWKLLQAIDGSDDYRLLRRLELKEGLTGVGGRVGTSVSVAVDVETTGIGDDDVVIELALRRFRFDPEGVIVKIDREYSWLDDPGRELEPDIVKLPDTDREAEEWWLAANVYAAAANPKALGPRIERVTWRERHV